MAKKKSLGNHHRVNWFQLILGLILNILVIIVTFIIYHQIFNPPQPYTGSMMQEPADNANLNNNQQPFTPGQ